METSTLQESDLAELVKNPVTRLNTARRSFLWFFNIYFAHYIEYEMAPFHYRMFDLVQRTDWRLLCLVAFRQSGKTTIMTRAHALWSILGQKEAKFVLIISATQAQAKQMMANIRNMVETNDMLKRDLGPFEEVADTWGNTTITFTRYGSQIRVASVNEQIRGISHSQYRPDLIIIDDPEDVQSAKTKEGRDKVYQWFKSEIMPLGGRTSRTVVVGNVVHEDCLTMRLKREILEGQTTGLYFEYPVITASGESAWPGMFPTLESIEEERRRIGDEQSWQREYMLRIISRDDQVIKREWIYTYEGLPAFTRENDFQCFVSGVDLAVKNTETSDYTAVVSAAVYGHGEKMKIYILPDPLNQRLNDFDEILTKLKEISTRIGKGTRTKMYIESNAALAYVFQGMQNAGYPVVEVINRGEKHERLFSIGPSFKNAQVVFPKQGCESLINQVVNFGIENHDDLVDALIIVVTESLKTIKRHNPFPDHGVHISTRDARPVMSGLRNKIF